MLKSNFIPLFNQIFQWFTNPLFIMIFENEIHILFLYVYQNLLHLMLFWKNVIFKYKQDTIYI